MQKARLLLNSRSHGVLSTHSLEVPGYPLGSLTPFVLDASGHPVILISAIAQHTANLADNPRCSLTVVEAQTGEIQAHGRLCLLADACPLNDAESAVISPRYQRFFPQSASYLKTHDFSFWVLRPRTLRYIGGFGNIHWLDGDTTLIDNPFAGQAEEAACAHMNADHADALKSYCLHAGLPPHEGPVVMVGVDAEGLHLRLGPTLHYLPFLKPVTDMQALRRETIAMCQAEYWSNRNQAA